MRFSWEQVAADFAFARAADFFFGAATFLGGVSAASDFCALFAAVFFAALAGFAVASVAAPASFAGF